MQEKSVNTEEISAGMPEFSVYENKSAALCRMYPEYAETHRSHSFPPDHYIYEVLGPLSTTLEVEKFIHDKKTFFVLSYHFCQNVNVLIVLPEWQLENDEKTGYLGARDVFFTNISTQKTVAVPLSGDIVFSKMFDKGTFTLTGELTAMTRVNLPGRTNLGLEDVKDPNLIQYYSVYKDIEALVFYHESAHPQQTPQQKLQTAYGFTKENAMVFRERDAWRYALEAIRFLRRNGIDLVPGLTATQIQARVDYLLLEGYDKNIHTPLRRKFSNVFNSLRGNKLTLPIIHNLNILRSKRKLEARDPTLKNR